MTPAQRAFTAFGSPPSLAEEGVIAPYITLIASGRVRDAAANTPVVRRKKPHRAYGTARILILGELKRGTGTINQIAVKIGVGRKSVEDNISRLAKTGEVHCCGLDANSRGGRAKVYGLVKNPRSNE